MIYLDHAATTPVDPRVADAMEPWLFGNFGNPSSPYALGAQARAAIDEARDEIARNLGVHSREIIFTSSGTESDNLALKGAAWARAEEMRAGVGSESAGSSGGTRPHIITTAIEHHAVLESCRFLGTQGFDVTYLPVDAQGQVSAQSVREALRPDTILISVMHANNETGTLQPIAEIAQVIQNHTLERPGARPAFHVDATQSFGVIPIDVKRLGIDFLTASSHKIYGPKGVGLLYARLGAPLVKLHHGGGQELSVRGGTENVAGVVGFGAAARFAFLEGKERTRHAASLRDQLQKRLFESGARGNGHLTERLPGHLNIRFDGIDGESLVINLDLEDIAASTGSACTTGSTEPSHVLLAMGLSPEQAKGALRLTIGKGNTEDEIDRAAEVIHRAVGRLREQKSNPKEANNLPGAAGVRP